MRWLIRVFGVLTVLAVAGPLEGQSTGQISGRVTSDPGEPLEGAAVQVIGTQFSSITDSQGRYSLAGIPTGTARVRATMLGYSPAEQTLTIAAAETGVADFQLQASAIAMDGIVAVGYGTQRRRDVTGSVASVRAEEIDKIPTANVLDALKGRVPGMDITASGYAPGAGVTVRVRGERSMRANNDPLYVIDGIPLSSGLIDFNPQDIESIEVLKDASATAIYGSRGANGVVLITTAKGQAGETQFSYDTYLGAQSIINPVDMMDGPQYAEMKREAHRAIDRYPCPDQTVCEEGDRAIFDRLELEEMQAGRWTDYPSLIQRTGVQHSHNLRVQAGNEQTRFAASLNYFDQLGITRSMGFDRQGGSLSIDHTEGRFRAGASVQASRSTQNLGRGDGLWSEALSHNPNGPPRDADGNLILESTSDGQMINPLFDLTNWIHDVERTRIFGTAFSELELLPGISWRVNFGPDITFRRDGQFRASETGANRGAPADAQQHREQVFAYTLDNLLLLQRQFGEHSLDFTGLYSIQRERSDNVQAHVRGLPYDHQRYHNLGSGSDVQGVGSGFREWSMQSYMGRLNYGFNDKYLLTLTGRVDGSSRLAPGNKYAFFPSVAAAWQIGDEPIMADVSFVSDLKLRASWGRTGNSAISPYQTQGGLQRTQYIFGDNRAFGYQPSQLENPDLGWETTEQIDIGLEFGMLGNRITGTADVYLSNTNDLLLQRQLPAATGFSNILENIGQTRNRGLELALSTVNLNNWRGVTWTTDVTFAMNRNEIVSLYGGNEDDVGNRWFIGQPIRVHYDYEFDGIWQLDQAEEAAGYGQKPGQIRVVDQNGDGTINAADRIIQGTSFPSWTGGLSNQLDWNSFDFSAFLVARQGATIFDSFGSQYANLRGRQNQLDVDYWTPTNPSNTHPRPDRTSTDPQVYSSSRGLVDGSFVRVRNLTLGYTLPDALVGRFGGESLRVYASAQDPFIFTSYIGFDPESGTGAGIPSYRTLLIGANLNF